MGFLNDKLGEGLSSMGLGSLTSKSLKPPTAFGPDYPEGFHIIEYVNGREAETIILAGSFMPVQPFKFGGSQHVVKEYYPGNSEPTVQVLGPREDDIQINGRLKLKNIKDKSLRDAAIEYQKQIEAMRIRGNMVKIKLRDWYRYGFIEKAQFDLNTRQDINYTINFSIIGFNVPKNSMFLSGTDENPVHPNKDLIRKAAAALQAMRNYPTSMPRSVTDILNGAISDVAGAIAVVTNFVNGILDDAEALEASAHRAIGLIKNARATISATSRRVGQIENTAGTLGITFMSEAKKTASTIQNFNHLHTIQASNIDLLSMLATLQATFANIAKSIPFRRHLVRAGDTLQKISMIYYNTSDNWQSIQKHNKLQSTDLVVGSVLEIPRL